MSTNQKTIFPKEIIEFSLENFLFKKSKKSNIIYLVIVAGVIVVLSLLPLLTIPITRNTIGSIQSLELKQQIYSPVAGRIISLKMMENERVNKGDLLLEIDRANLLIQMGEIIPEGNLYVQPYQNTN